ncbi:hypothetical protein MPLDJ20_20175 [Mesorhizobium plurifarium]|uniref:Uncharacterized protein n=1 Tax=Mesorhizobium plurifarium TaxID=69974 RepID=A0A090GKG6_MESPL|nr:hypothetical protein MPLDJ20_20175 [Mesorhizobium plurifarium]
MPQQTAPAHRAGNLRAILSAPRSIIWPSLWARAAAHTGDNEANPDGPPRTRPRTRRKA